MTRLSHDGRPGGAEIRQISAAYRAHTSDTLPPAATPAHRLVAAGPSALTDSELVLALLDSPHTSPTARDLRQAEDTLHRLGGLRGLLRASHATLAAEFGAAQAIRLKAAVDLALRLTRSELDNRQLLDQPPLVAQYVSLHYLDSHQEVLGALYLDTQVRLIEPREIFRGNHDHIKADPRPILKHGLLLGASRLVLFHTHPNGDPTPSPEDLALTRRVAEAGQLLHLELVDHIVVGVGGRWVSLKRRGGW